MNPQSISLQLDTLLHQSRARLFQDYFSENYLDFSAKTRSKRLRRQVFALGGLLTGFSMLAAIIGFAGTNGHSAIRPEVWSHGTFALVAAQSLILIGAALKMMTSVEQSEEMVQRLMRAQSRNRPPLQQKLIESGVPPRLTPPPIVAPPAAPEATGMLGDRRFVRRSDGSVEVETLLGRRRFVSMDAAQEFVGGSIVCDNQALDQPAANAA